jgi:hypothetical protein
MNKSAFWFQFQITIAFIIGGFLGFTLNDFSPLVTKFVSSPVGTFVLVYISLFVVEKLTKSRAATVGYALIFTVILRALIYGSNYLWANYKDDPKMKKFLDNPLLFSQEPNYKEFIQEQLEKEQEGKRSLAKGNKSFLGYTLGIE